MHIRRDNDIRPPLLQSFPRPASTSVMIASWVLAFAASLSINGKKAGVGTSASVTMVRCVSQPRAELPHR